MIEDFDNVYEEKKQNKQKNLLQQFFSLNFVMKIKNRFENFEKFLTRFTFTINSLKFTDNEKITHLFRNFFEQLTKRIYHLNEIVKYSNYVKKVRQTTNQMKIRNEMKQNATISSIMKKRRFRANENVSRKQNSFKKISKNKFKTRKFNAMKNMIIKLSSHIRTKFRKAKKCFKCEKVKHVFNDSNASCQEKNHITRKKIEVFFSKMNIE